VERAAARLHALGERPHRAELPEAPVGEAVGDAHEVLRHHAAGAEVQVAHLGVAHLSLGEPDGAAARREEGPGRPLPEPVPDRSAGELDGVALALGAVAPAVEDDEDHPSLAV